MISLLLFIHSIFSGGFSSQIYDQNFLSLDSSTVNFSSFKGKKVLITEFNSSNSDSAQLQYLDSLQRNDTSIVVIAVPAIDFGGAFNKKDLKKLKNSFNSNFIISSPASVKKKSGSKQHPLFKWLTKVSENEHFDDEIEVAGQLYIISKKGVLYAVLGKETPKSIITEALQANKDK